MINLKKIVKEGLHGRFWWMDPQGKITRVMKLDPQTGHRETAIELLTAMGRIPEKDVFKQMYNLGWLRIEFGGDRGTYTLGFNNNGNEPNARQVSSLKDLAEELSAHEIVHISTKKTYPFGIWR